MKTSRPGSSSVSFYMYICTHTATITCDFHQPASPHTLYHTFLHVHVPLYTCTCMYVHVSVLASSQDFAADQVFNVPSNCC